MNTIIRTLLLSITVSITGFAYSFPINLPSVNDYTSGDGWGVSVGLKMASVASYKGSDHYILEIKPDGAIQWRTGQNIFYWESFDLNNTEFGWRGVVNPNMLIEAGVIHQTVIPSGRSENAGLIGLPHRGSHIITFVDVKHSINNNWKNWVSGRFLSGSSLYGWMGEVSAGHNFGKGVDNTGTELLVFSTFGNESHMNNFFGVSEADAVLSGLKRIYLEGGYRSTGLKLVYRENISESIQVVASAGIESYSSEIDKSELVTDSLETNTDISILWRF